MKKITLFIFLLAMSIGYSQTTLQDFEDGGLGEAFGGAAGEIVADPAPGGTRGQVAKLTGVAGEIWQGINVNIASNYVLLEVKTIEIDVYSLSAITFAPKAQGGVAGSPESVSTATHTGSGWETLTVTFDQSLDGKAPANGEYSQFAIHYFWDTTSNGFGTASDRIFYIDNIKGSIPKDIIQDFEDGGLGEAFGGAAGEIVADPASGGTRGQVAKLTGVAGEIWQGINVNIASNYKLVEEKTIEIDVYSLSAITFAPKAQGGLAGAPESVSTATHTGSGWETLTVTFDQSLDGKAPANGEYSQFAIHYFWDTTSNGFGTASDRVFYVDNIKAIKVTLPVIQNPVGLPLTFDDDSELFSLDESGGTGGAVAIENGKLKISGNGQPWDNVNLNLTSPIDLSDAANNTITFTMEPLLVPEGEIRNHLLAIKLGAAAAELDFTTTGPAEQTVTVNYGPGLLDNYDFIQIFTDARDQGNGKIADYLIDNISIGADPVILNPVGLPLTFEDDSELFAHDSAGGAGGSVAIENGKLKVSGNGHQWDNVSITLDTPFDLSDAANNTISFSIEPLLVPDGEVRTHLFKVTGAGAMELDFTTTGSAEQLVTINFGPNLGATFNYIQIFTDAKDQGVGKAADYLIDNISIGADPAATCTDGIMNQDETGIDCGGVCNACPETAPTTAPIAPPTRNAEDVISLYSEAYTNVASNFDAGWCGTNSIEEATIAGNKVQAYKGNDCQGIVLTTGVDASAFTNLHVDVYIEAGVDVTSKVFNLKFVQQPGGTAIEVNFNAGSSPALVAGSWLAIDVAVDLSTMTGFKEFGITANNLKNQVWYDNLYVYRSATTGVNDNAALNVSMYPNPTSGVLNISAENTIEDATIYNVLGTAVMSLDINNNSEAIDVSVLTSGIYLIKYTVGDAVGTAKFIKE
jgi:preprotein translocase subunit SecG